MGNFGLGRDGVWSEGPCHTVEERARVTHRLLDCTEAQKRKIIEMETVIDDGPLLFLMQKLCPPTTIFEFSFPSFQLHFFLQ